MELSWHEFFGLAFASGAAAGLANQGFRFFHDLIADKRNAKTQARELTHQETMQVRDLAQQETMQERELVHQRDLQAEEREHEAAVRREAAFAEAKKELLPLAVAVSTWIDWSWGKAHGELADYFPPPLPDDATVRGSGDVIHALKQISGRHPAKTVRRFAGSLSDQIDNSMNFAVFSGSGEIVNPDPDEFARWDKMAHELIESMHDPGHQPVDPGPGRRPGT